MKKILPVNEPLVSTYTSYGALFSLLTDKMEPWVYNNFIQIRYNKSWRTLTFDEHRSIMSDCPGLAFYPISREIIDLKFNHSIKDAIVEAINMNKYLMIFIDYYYFSLKQFYLKEHTEHELFIYGYDLEKDLIYVGDNIQKGKFKFVSCPFQEIIDGYNHIPSDTYRFLTDIRFVGVEKDASIKINCNQIIDRLEAYLYSRPTYDLMYEQECGFGTEIIRQMTAVLKEHTGKFDIRPFHLLYEHKLLMEKRVQYLLENGYLKEEDIKLSDFTLLREQMKSIRNGVIRYNLTFKESRKEKLIEEWDKVRVSEEKLIKQLIDALKKTVSMEQ